MNRENKKEKFFYIGGISTPVIKASAVNKNRTMTVEDYKKGLVEKNGQLVFSKSEVEIFQNSYHSGMRLDENVSILQQIGCSDFVIGYIMGQLGGGGLYYNNDAE
ncbi:MAG TPA: hypothetical protein ENH28_07515 [Euryarchaeota archaeon]|nr:hypothetical protein [Euryarchaeota archaeon]